MFLFLIQTAQQQEEGLWIMGILVTLIIIGGIWAKGVESTEISALKNKLLKGDVDWDDYYKALNNDYKNTASEIYTFLNNKEKERLKEEADKIYADKDLENADKRVNKVLKILQDNTHKCNKCGGSYMRIWRLNQLDIELRCESCKKKFLYNQDFYTGINLHHFLGDIYLLKKRYQLQDSNPMLRKLDFKFDFEGQKSNSPNTYPIAFHSLLEPLKSSRKKSIDSSEESVRSRTIRQDVKDKVWNRDGGRCVECGSNENLEFDHIIPFSKGGANTYRNLQLLCQNCNREKSDKIG